MALTEMEIADQLKGQDWLHTFWSGLNQAIVRIRPEEYEELVTYILYKLGSIRSPGTIDPILSLYKKYKHDERMSNLLWHISQLWIEDLSYFLNNKDHTKTRAWNPLPFIDHVKSLFGTDGLIIGVQLVEEFVQYTVRSPWSSIRRVEWEDTIALKDLFESEALEAYYGNFIDQRYIDYLDRNFNRIDDINWRKFEGLTGEFFTRLGYHVELGPGRNDDGIDVRVWRETVKGDLPPLIIVQCKRQKEKVSKLVVKGLWADLVNEKAKAGLIVTTSSISPGAKKVCIARGYPIEAIERETLKQWLNNMRTLRSGPFMSE